MNVVVIEVAAGETVAVVVAVVVAAINNMVDEMIIDRAEMTIGIKVPKNVTMEMIIPVMAAQIQPKKVGCDVKN